MVADQIRGFLEHGNVHNAVNFPEVNLPRATPHRLVCAGAGGPALASLVADALRSGGVTIHDMANLSRGELTYLVADLDKPPSAALVTGIGSISGVRMARSIGGD
jgi:D-3-phosphoglycerate dehydrogenase